MIAAGYPINLPGFLESEDDPKVRVTIGKKRSKVLIECIYSSVEECQRVDTKKQSAQCISILPYYRCE